MSEFIDSPISRQFDKLPPHDIDAEMCVIGSLLMCGDDKQAFDLTRTRLRSDDFYLTDHQILFDAICALADAGKPIDATIVRDRLRTGGLYEEVGGDAYIGALLHKVPNYAHGPHYAAIVRNKSVARQGISISNDLLRAVYAPQEDSAGVSALLREYGEKLLMVATIGTSDAFVTLKAAVDAMIQRKETGAVPRIPTGLTEVDAMIGGIPKRKFVLIGARPAMGKSLVGKQLALNIAKEGRAVGIVTIEEEEGKIAENVVANYSGIENNRVSFGNLGQHEWNEISLAAQKLGKLPIWINDKPVTLSEVEEAITTAVIKHKCELIIVDYLQLISTDKPMENENRELTIISKTLKRLAKHLNIGLVALCQLNRGNEVGQVRPPRISDLRGSGSLDQDGDIIVLLHRQDYYRPDGESRDSQLRFDIAKNKDGDSGVVPLHFSGKYQRITDWNNGAGGAAPKRSSESAPSDLD